MHETPNSSKSPSTLYRLLNEVAKELASQSPSFAAYLLCLMAVLGDNHDLGVVIDPKGTYTDPLLLLGVSTFALSVAIKALGTSCRKPHTTHHRLDTYDGERSLSDVLCRYKDRRPKKNLRKDSRKDMPPPGNRTTLSP